MSVSPDFTDAIREQQATTFTTDGIRVPGIDNAVAQGVVTSLGGGQRSRAYTPWVTLALWVTQVIGKASCSETVLRHRLWRTAKGLPQISKKTGAYCQARKRLPLEMLIDLLQKTGRALHERQEHRLKLFGGRPIKIVDGTQVSMADTDRNQAVYPQDSQKKPGTGFPVARVIMLVCMATGAVVGAAIGATKGKLTAELSLLVKLRNQLIRGDILVGDGSFSGWAWMACMLEQGVDMVAPKHGSRKVNWEKGESLGHRDSIQTWKKLSGRKSAPTWLSKEEYAALPSTIKVRVVERTVSNGKGKPYVLCLVTTMFTASVDDLFQAYSRRWDVEVDIRSIKGNLGMDDLRCVDYTTVEKEIYVELIANNAIRSTAVEALDLHSDKTLEVRNISYKATVDSIRIQSAQIYDEPNESMRAILFEYVCSLIVKNRPNRYEPRLYKSRPKSAKFGYLLRPRESFHLAA